MDYGLNDNLLLDEDMNDVVAEYAVKLHSILKKVISKYGEESICELFPLCVEILENFNCQMVNNEKLSTYNTDLLQRCEDLSSTFESLKIIRQKDFEKALKIQDDLEQELFDSKEKTKYLERKVKACADDLRIKSDTIVYLNDTINCLNLQIENLLNEKINLQNENAFMGAQYYIPLQYPTISVPMAVPAMSLNIFEGRGNKENTAVYSENVPNEFMSNEFGRKKQKNNLNNVCVSLYSDNLGKDLSVLLKQLSPKNIFIKPSLVKCGAPLSELVRVVKLDANSFGDNDFVTIIGGSNDIGFNSEVQILQAFDDLLASNMKCKFVISTIPPRYDLSPYSDENNLIRKINLDIKTSLNKHESVKILDLGSKHRRFFALDGKHFNFAGKTSLVKDIYKIIGKC